jgi:Hypothetical glycosyl hydrolase family 15
MAAFVRFLAVASALTVVATAAGAAAAPGSPAAGTVRFVKVAGASFDVYTRSPNVRQRAFIRSHYWRLTTYSPYFDSRLAWAPNAWFYKDAYAIYPDSPVADAHPDWILRDASGNKLWIQYACSNGRCTQYAADIGNPAFRDWWIRTAKQTLAAGYKGIFIDDVNMIERISNGDGDFTVPVDPRTRRPLDEATWRHLMAGFMAQVRAALPHAELVHNVLWFAGDGSADLRRELASANYVEIEHGFNDPGIVGGSGTFGFRTLLAFIAHRHAAGQGVIVGSQVWTRAELLYGLAAYFLVSTGRDALSNDGLTPDNWRPEYDVRLGAPLGRRYLSNGVWRRDFTRGTVLVNEPGDPTRRVVLGVGYRDLAGTPRRAVTLGSAAAEVLLRGRAGAR